jgi:hypothetical protein
VKQNYTKGLESLMDIITQKIKNTKRYLPHELKTRIYAVEMYRNCGDIEYVCRYQEHHCGDGIRSMMVVKKV